MIQRFKKHFYTGFIIRNIRTRIRVPTFHPQFCGSKLPSNKYSNFFASKSYCFRLSGGELFDKISEQEYLTEVEAACYTKQVLQGVGYLHDKSIVHLDIKVKSL